MAKLFLIVAAVLAFIVFVTANNNDLGEFSKIFNDMHKEPQIRSTRKRHVRTLWIRQKLDHFDKNETRTWRMRYISNDKLYKPGGPLFIIVGAEWTISSGNIRSGHFYDMAKEHNGYLFYTEHRFFGKSRPVDAMTNENLKYLDAQQALADLAHFIRTMKATIPGLKDSKAILTGCSHAGSLVTWFKRLYPDLAAGVWASSAVLYNKVDFSEFKEVMGETIKVVGGRACYDRIARGTAELESMLANGRAAEVKTMLGLCDTFSEDNHLDVSTLFYEISELFANLIQYRPEEIKIICQGIMKGASDATGLANYAAYKFNDFKGCKDLSYVSYVSSFRDTGFGDASVMRAWHYMSCNQLGTFQTSSSPNQPFGTKYPLEFFVTLCRDLFGDKYTKEYIEMRVNETNKIFGGFEPGVENGYWTHGQVDGWKVLGMQGERVTIIPYRTHCDDFGSISSRDNAESKASKEKVAALVRKWLA